MIALHQARRRLQLKLPQLQLDQLPPPSPPLLAIAFVAGATNDKPTTNDTTKTRRFNMAFDLDGRDRYNELHFYTRRAWMQVENAPDLPILTRL